MHAVLVVADHHLQLGLHVAIVGRLCGRVCTNTQTNTRLQSQIIDGLLVVCWTLTAHERVVVAERLVLGDVRIKGHALRQVLDAIGQRADGEVLVRKRLDHLHVHLLLVERRLHPGDGDAACNAMNIKNFLLSYYLLVSI